MFASLWPHGLQHARPRQLLKLAQVHVHCIGDATQPSHPLTPSSPSSLNLSQHQQLFKWAVCLHQMTKILELQLQHQYFQWVFRVDLPSDWLAWSPCCPGDSQEFSLAPQLESINFGSTSLWSNSYIHPYMTTGKTTALTLCIFISKVIQMVASKTGPCQITGICICNLIWKRHICRWK